MHTKTPDSLFVEWDENKDHRITTWTGSPRHPISQQDAEVLLKSGRVPDTVAAEMPEEDAETVRSGYHCATRDHPFLDMSSGNAARIEDAAIMAGFVLTDEYPDIYLDLEPAGDAVRLPHALHLGMDELRLTPHCRLALILGGALGVVREQQPYYDPVTDYYQVANLRKSVPSGGARHPTEAFLEIHRAPGISPGCYQFSTQLNALVPITSLTPDPHLQETVSASSADYLVTMYLHSVVERAYFRYRDPRSMRAILVDAGHVEGQISALASYCNWHYQSRLDIKLEEIFERRDGTVVHAPRLASGVLQGWI